jgi:glycerate dehydrogenase
VANCLTPAYHEIAGKTWGVLGYGNIGGAVGRIASAMGCRVLAYKRTPVEGVECVDLETVCRESDILSIHLPLNDTTRGILDAEHIAMLKTGAIVINVARGAVTDEAALAEALVNGQLGGLGVDVYSTEPFPESHPFYSLRERENVCLTPHMAWGSIEARQRCLGEIVLNMEAFLRGEQRNRLDV